MDVGGGRGNDQMMTRDAHDVGATPVRLVICLGLLIALSAMLFGVIAGLNRAWFMLGFEVVCVVAGLLTLALRRGGGFGVGSASLAATVVGASFLGAIGADRAFLGWFGTPLFVTSALVRVEFDPLLLSRFLLSGALAAIGGWAVIARHPRVSLRALGRAGVVLGVLVVLLGGAWIGRGRLAGLGTPIQAMLVVVGFLLVTGLLSAMVHLVVHAFSPRGSAHQDR